MMVVEIFMVVCVNDLKRTCVHVMPRASLCTTTYEAASTVEVWSPLLSWEYVHGNQEGWMIWSMLIIIGIYAVIVGMLVMWNYEKK